MTQQPLDTSPPVRIVPGVEADRLATAVYAALLADLGGLSPSDWEQPTECAGRTVRDVVAHLVGAAQGHASLPVLVRQYIWGLRNRRAFGGSSLDAMNQYEIDGQADLSPDLLVATLARLAPLAVAGRSRRARRLGWAPFAIDEAGSWSEGTPSRMTMAELCAVVLTRDVWAHRLDIARAVGRQPTLEPDVDARIVADVVADWAARHGQPVSLILTGDAGGTFTIGASGESLTLDALDFARLLAGRRPDGDVPDSPLWATKLLF